MQRWYTRNIPTVYNVEFYFRSFGQALRLYNHFNWLPQLQERSEQLLAVVGRERRLSLSLVRKGALGEASRGLPRDSTGGSVEGVERRGGHDSTGETAGDKNRPLLTQEIRHLLRILGWFDQPI